MSGNIKRFRARLHARQQGKTGGHSASPDSPVSINHSHDADYAYFTVTPLPDNGVLRFTPEQYASLLKVMVQVHDGLCAAADAKKAAKGKTDG